MRTRLLFALLLLAAPAVAQAPAVPPPAAPPASSFAAQMLEGSWALRVEGTVVFRFDLARSGDGWSGTWARPTAFATDGAMFAELGGPPVEARSLRGRAIGEWAELAFGDARPGAIPDVFRFRLTSPERAEMIYTDTGQAPFVLERVAPGTAPGPWTDGQIYRRPGVRPGTLVSFNVASRVAPAPRPTSAPVEAERPAEIIGR